MLAGSADIPVCLDVRGQEAADKDVCAPSHALTFSLDVRA